MVRANKKVNQVDKTIERNTPIKNKNIEGKKFKRREALSVQSYSIKNKKEGHPFFIRVDSNIETKIMLKKDGTDDTDEDGKVKMLSHVIVTDLETGEQGDMVLPYLVKKAFDTFIVDNELKGACFELVKGAKKNRTNEWNVYTIDV